MTLQTNDATLSELDTVLETFGGSAIVRIEAIPYSIPYRKPLRFASGSVSTADHVLIRIYTSDGIVGVGDAGPRPYTYGETQQSIIAIIANIFEPALVGTNPYHRARVREVLARTIGNNAAKGAIDIALWDILGKRSGLAVSTMLGGYTNAVRVSHMLGFLPVSELLDEAVMMRESFGIDTFKIKVGRRPLDLDVQACIALRAGLGSQATLYLDANRGWTANEALDVLDRTEDLGLSLLEEPCDARENLGRKRVVARSNIPIVGDESVPTAGDVARELLAGGCNAVSIKTARGGFTEAQEILGVCTGLGVDVLMGNQIDTQIGTIATISFGAAFEHTTRRASELSNFLEMTDDLIAEQLVIADGMLRVSPRPGVGAVIDQDKLAAYRVDGGR